MYKQSLLFLATSLLLSSLNAQPLNCEKLARQIEADTTKSIWDIDTISDETYYCLGKYFAQRDIAKNIFLIHTYGSPEWDNPCRACKYKDYGFRFYYHFDIVYDSRTNFIKGYNEISEALLKQKTGDSVFAQIDDSPKDYFNPREVLQKNLDGKQYQNVFITEPVNDSVLWVKLIVDTLFKDYPQFAKRIVYHVSDFNLRNKSGGKGEDLNHEQIQNGGFCLTQKSKGKYYMKINFDFRNIAKDEKYCWCALMDEKEFGYVIPLIIKE